METHIIVASINKLENIDSFASSCEDDTKIIIIDENEKYRKYNKKILNNLNYKFYGIKERNEWFQKRFGKIWKKYISVLPSVCRGRISFGFLVAYEEDPDMVVEIDDDVFALNDKFLKLHYESLFMKKGIIVESNSKWYNTLENIVPSTKFFARGYPYDIGVRSGKYFWKKDGRECVLNMGLWKNNIDLDATFILSKGSINGRLFTEVKKLKRSKIIIGKNNFFPLCAMNTAFQPKIIPAFYQLYMNFMGVDRFDDIWSGIFLKKIADHMGDNISIGEPIIEHNKKQRNIFDDIGKEYYGMKINEALWKIVDKIEVSGNTYFDCYSSIIEGLENNLNCFNKDRKFMNKQIEKMKLWLKVIDKIK